MRTRRRGEGGEEAEQGGGEGGRGEERHGVVGGLGWVDRLSSGGRGRGLRGCLLVGVSSEIKSELEGGGMMEKVDDGEGRLIGWRESGSYV